MAQRINVSFDEGDYSVYATSPPINYALSRRQAGILLSVAILLIDRRNWQSMSDADWNTLENEISKILEVLNG